MDDKVVINSTQKKAIWLMLGCTVFTSLGQLLWKLGLANVNFRLPLTLLNLPFLLGFVAYGLGFGMMLLAFKKGELGVLYPIIATSYVWVSLSSPIIFPNDFMNGWKWLGVLVIIISVSLLGYSSSKRKSREEGKIDSSIKQLGESAG
ncbi:MAG TPA: hypothetical protein VJG49_03720 [Candidatus Nanoarchaeia archaeon]|nr:hypothetical protein [Candidatus Nanoarchaeia archaeon]